ncbi:MAG TPA: hypothetical protein VGH03_16910 [Caulobacteraceae bacterium]|jgi:hypothetical protein
MSTFAVLGTPDVLDELSGAVRVILEAQRPDGAIPWFQDGPWDAWNHAECLMALDAVGELDAVRRGLECLAVGQRGDGAWLCGYGNALPMEGRDRMARGEAPKVCDTNFAGYPATALWRMWLSRRDTALTGRYWPMVRSAIGFVLSCQHPEGDVSWCGEAHGTAADDAVLSGCASLYASLGHAFALAEIIGDPHPQWLSARARLGTAIRERSDRFDRAGADRSGFAMDWYYPVLAGVVRGEAATARIEEGWRRFVEPGRGCRCVAAEPWATVAESAELALTLIRLGRRGEAAAILDWQNAHRDADGAWWMGWQFAEDIPWPLEKPTWTQAAVILAREALDSKGPASRVLIEA